MTVEEELEKVKEKNRELLDEKRKRLDKIGDLENELSAIKAERDKFKGEKDTLAGELEQHKTDSEAALAALNTEHAAKLAELETGSKEQVKAARLEAIALREGLVDVDGLKLIDLSKITQKDDGTFEGVEDVFKAAREAKPYLFGEKQTSTSSTVKTPKAGDQQPVNALKLTDEEYQQQKAAMLRQAR